MARRFLANVATLGSITSRGFERSMLSGSPSTSASTARLTTAIRSIKTDHPPSGSRQAPSAASGATGGLEPLTVTAEVSEADALFIARTLHRWARANSRPRRITVWRTNQRTGEVRPRHAHRRSVRLTSRTGFVAVNDGSAMGQALARALVARCPLECGRQRASTDQ